MTRQTACAACKECIAMKSAACNASRVLEYKRSTIDPIDMSIRSQAEVMAGTHFGGADQLLQAKFRIHGMRCACHHQLMLSRLARSDLHRERHRTKQSTHGF